MSERAAAEARARKLAAGIWRDGGLQEEASCAAVVAQLEALLARFPDSLPIAEHLATACEVAVRHKVGPRECWSFVERIVALDLCHRSSARIAGSLVGALKWTAGELPSAEERLAVVDRIEAVVARFPDNVAMAEDLAFALRAVGVRARHGLLVTVLARADALRLRFPDSGEIAASFAHLLCYAVQRGSRSDKERAETACAWHRTVRVIASLLERFPGNEDLAEVLGQALSKEGRARRSVLGREACAARIAALAERFPTSTSLAQSQANAIAAVGRLHRTIPGRRECIARIQALQVRFPRVARIGFALERLTSPYQYQPVAAPLARDGFASRRVWLDDEALQRIDNLLAEHVAMDARPAVRDVFERCPELRALLAATPMQELADEAVGADAFPIAAILFDKRPGSNWVVGAHQDLAMPVAARSDADGFTGWSTKGGVPWALPPDRVLANLVALRLHLEECPADNGALAVLPGSHLRGRWSPAELSALHREQFLVLPALRGDVLVLRPLLVHRSSPAVIAERRRVLHVVYAREHPLPVRWRTGDDTDRAGFRSRRD